MTTNEQPSTDEIGTWEPYYRAIMGSPQIAHRDKRAVQMANEQPNPDQTGTWTPNCTEVVLGLLKTEFMLDDWTTQDMDLFGIEMTEVVVREYRRQQAEHGMVEVRRETLQELVNRYSGLRDRYYREAREILAAATEEQQ